MTITTENLFVRLPDIEPDDPFFGLDDDCSVQFWPSLADLSLSEHNLRIRRNGIGGSDANTLLSGNLERVRRLWAEKRGDLEPADLSGNVAVALGTWTEPFNRQWYERLTTQRVDRVGLTAACLERPWRRCTLDGFVESAGAIWEAKHTSAFASQDEVLQRYMPQLQHNMAVMKTDRAILSIIFGNHKYEIVEVAADWIYQIELLEAETDFWDCVHSGREPVPAAPPMVPRPVGSREICLDGNNAWADSAQTWLENREAAKRHASACAQIKDMVEPDVTRAFGHGIEAKRSKAGAISIRELVL